ncbi:MAG: family 20 glycosylhydrolase [Lentisphaeria bacterium]|nr:family 20 glycosylhydrolase [Lentisphaeria bacterium]
MMENLDVLLPRPQSIISAPGVVKVESLGSVSAPAGWERIGGQLIRNAGIMGLDLTQEGVPVKLILSEDIKVESFEITVAPDEVTISGGDPAGLFYGAGAFEQLLCISVIRGTKGAEIPCGKVADSPRFGYRGFMLDSARHIQSVETIKSVLALMAKLRLNVFHWHLCDSQGYRAESKLFPELNTLADMTPGFFTAEEIKEICDFAAECFITVIPEIEMPGHSRGVIALHPELACDPEDPGKEFCLAKPEVREFLEKLIAEFASLFPASKVIHLGGDEAETEHWEKCPACQKLMKEKGLSNLRQLENDFMNDMASYVRSLGLTPVTWFTGSIMEHSTIIQAWRSIHELKETLVHGNRMIFSVHDQLYLDYPCTAAEPFENWMPVLGESGVYNTEPFAAWEKQIGDLLLGPETCLWTETVPDHRIFAKLLPRLIAFSETAWCRPAQKDWFSYIRRKDVLSAGAWFDMKAL